MSVRVTAPASGSHLVAGQALTVTAVVDNPQAFKKASLNIVRPDGTTKQIASDYQLPLSFIWASPVSQPTGTLRLRVSAQVGSRWYQADFTIVVDAPAPTPVAPVINPATLPAATQGQPFSTRLSVTGGSPPYALRVTQGNPPPGISLVGDTIQGTPTAAGLYAFTVSMFTSLGRYDGFRDYVLSVNPSSVPVPDPVPQPGGAVVFSENFEDGSIDLSKLVLWTKTEQVASSPWGGKALLLRTVSSTAGSGAPNSQMACVYMNAPNARGSEGLKTRYNAKLGIPAGTTPPAAGQWWWLEEWHISDAVPQNTTGTRAASCALGIWSNFTDRYTGKAYGPSDFVLVIRIAGGDYANPYGSDQNAIGTYHVLCPYSALLGKLTPISFEYLWTQQMGGYCKVSLNGQLVWTYQGPTLFRTPTGVSDQVGFGLYNYHPAIAVTNDVWWDDLSIEAIA